MSKITIVLADDHQIVRQGLRALLEAEEDFSVVGETGDGLEAVRLVERLRPNVLVLDLVIPALNGLEVTRQVCKPSEHTQVVILSMHANEAYVLQALRNGAAAYVLKESSATDLAQAVREAAAGRHYLSPPLSEQVIEAYLHKAAAATPDPDESLTTREREVLQLVAEGHSNGEIGARLFISARTVEIHRSNMMKKLELNSQADLIHYALKRGILSTERPTRERKTEKSKDS